MNDLIALAHHSTSSRVLDAYLESPTVPLKAKRQLVLSFINHYHLLVDDRIGSRIGDRCWAFADPYLKVRYHVCRVSHDMHFISFQEKIGRSLIPHEHFLAGSFYGKFFARNLNLHLLQRRPEEWKTIQAERKRVAQGHSPRQLTAIEANAEDPAPGRGRKRRRSARPGDEIDALFDAALGKKTKKGTFGADDISVGRSYREVPSDESLQDVLGAIRAAPKIEKGRKRK